MTGYAEATTHGVNLINYINGETANKKHPEKIFHVEDRFLPEGLDAQGIYDMMRCRCNKMQRNVIHIEISPAKEHTENFSIDDWRKLWHDFMLEFDALTFKKDGKTYSHKTNIYGSRSTCWLHLDSKSQVPHLHAAVCRKDENGITNNDHDIQRRVQIASENVAIKRGWQTAWEKHAVNIDHVNADCMEILRTMPRWNWNDYVARLTAKGYQVNANPDSKGQLHGYSIQMGNSRYKASELGRGRNLMYSKLESTWNKLHPAMREGISRPSEQVIVKPQTATANLVNRYSAWEYNATRHDITNDGKSYRVYIPERVETVLQDEIDHCEYRDWQEAQELAVALFIGLLATPETPVSVGGGGGSSNSRDKKDEDEMERMRRCARLALSHFGRKKSSGRSR